MIQSGKAFVSLEKSLLIVGQRTFSNRPDKAKVASQFSHNQRELIEPETVVAIHADRHFAVGS